MNFESQYLIWKVEQELINRPNPKFIFLANTQSSFKQIWLVFMSNLKMKCFAEKHYFHR